MPRPKPAGIGDNSLSDEDQRALLIYHFDRLRQQEGKKLAKKAEYDVEAAALTDLFRTAKADGYTRKELQSLLDDTSAIRRDLTAEEERRTKLRGWLGLPSGTQLDLFQTPLEVQDEAHAKGQGYAMGLRGEACQMPDTMATRFAQAFADGWGKGQEELSWALSAAGRIVDRRKDANASPVALQPEPDEAVADPLDPEAIDDEARRLEASGWAEPSADESEFADDPKAPINLADSRAVRKRHAQAKAAAEAVA